MSSDERTEKATPKKKKDEREKGHVMQSRDLSTAVQLVLLIFIMSTALTQMNTQLLSMVHIQLTSGVRFDQALSINQVMDTYRQVIGMIFKILLPILATAVLGSLAIHLIQTRFLVTTKTLAVKADRINPISGFKRMFSIQSVVACLQSILKIVVLVLMIQSPFKKALKQAVFLIRYPIGQSVSMLIETLFDLALLSAFVLLGLSLIDVLYQWWQYEKGLRMSKQEIKDEFKQLDGDPQTKSRIRSVQRQMATRRMMQNVPTASVVITNPTHLAIALRYVKGKDSAPVVVAKGKDLIALKIREIAVKNRVAVVENKPLAQALHAHCDIGQQIPVSLYEAVAEVLAALARVREERQ